MPGERERGEIEAQLDRIDRAVAELQRLHGPGNPSLRDDPGATEARAASASPRRATTCGGLPFKTVASRPPQDEVRTRSNHTVHTVSRETFYAVAFDVFRRASRRRYAARMPSAAGVKPSSRPACPTVRGRAVSSLERASLERPGTPA